MTVGQRRGLGLSAPERRYALEVDAASATVDVGTEDDLLTDVVELTGRTWVAEPAARRHRRARPGERARPPEAGRCSPRPACAIVGGPERRVAPGQTVALYVGDEVVGSGIGNLN